MKIFMQTLAALHSIMDSVSEAIGTTKLISWNLMFEYGFE